MPPWPSLLSCGVGGDSDDSKGGGGSAGDQPAQTAGGDRGEGARDREGGGCGGPPPDFNSLGDGGCSLWFGGWLASPLAVLQRVASSSGWASSSSQLTRVCSNLEFASLLSLS